MLQEGVKEYMDDPSAEDFGELHNVEFGALLADKFAAAKGLG